MDERLRMRWTGDGMSMARDSTKTPNATHPCASTQQARGCGCDPVLAELKLPIPPVVTVPDDESVIAVAPVGNAPVVQRRGSRSVPSSKVCVLGRSSSSNASLGWVAVCVWDWDCGCVWDCDCGCVSWCWSAEWNSEHPSSSPSSSLSSPASSTAMAGNASSPLNRVRFATNGRLRQLSLRTLAIALLGDGEPAPDAEAEAEAEGESDPPPPPPM